jgi:hypothetical protein
VYSVVPTLLDTIPSITIGVTVGADQPAASYYEALSGQIRISRDANGKYHFASVNPIPTRKTIDIRGGVPNAPGSMTLTIVDAY